MKIGNFNRISDEFDYLIRNLSLAEILGNEALFFQIEHIKQLLGITDGEGWDDEIDSAL